LVERGRLAAFAIVGFLGVISLGIGLARRNRMLRSAGLALAASVFVMFLFPPAGILVAASLIWIALVVWRADSNPLGVGVAPYPAR
jgi:hypothetical protein